MNRAAQNQGFTCEHCGASVVPLTNGSYRNHCPACLWSKHVDLMPGDRAATCHGLMRPQHIEHRRKKGLAIMHRCVECGFVRANRIADDLRQSDDVDAIAALMSRLTSPLR
ncbi:RNHCP domain-containing protein [Streptomyces sp. 3MP-14]|uniref:RNHCP domain-containing protein n=1 Tax=Streptomyces mimosae TaxID=2586635 RepID=A0A5N6A1H4_9ACTN|nr:RNHCP domain-containing protein [Streptomyces sp. 3MP-14]KAB8161716.1 RNHCP domain-containing protein [Streptomyces mimosae]KAB8175016.1 RNHCP domain-containing protein [Streptomyces sp. 3MP-14]